ncbi:hypothetical protein J6590_017899 [Homalodisca vitripennis]|nr:hypothetical protein J6590_017899 [Homalodisca vitripennis]
MNIKETAFSVFYDLSRCHLSRAVGHVKQVLLYLVRMPYQSLLLTDARAHRPDSQRLGPPRGFPNLHISQCRWSGCGSHMAPEHIVVTGCGGAQRWFLLQIHFTIDERHTLSLSYVSLLARVLDL